MNNTEPSGIAAAGDGANFMTVLPPGIAEQRPGRFRHKRHSLFKRFQMLSRVRAAVKGLPEPNYAQFNAGVSGNLPDAGAGGVVLAACNEYYYWLFARTFVASIERAGQPQSVHLHLCTPQPRVLENIRELAERLISVKLTWTTDQCRLAEGLAHPSIYYAASRFLLAPLILERTDSPVLAVDVDGIVVQPIWQIYARGAAEVDIAVVERPNNKEPTRKILASAVGFNPTPEGRKFARQLAHTIASALVLHPHYHIDQILIHYVLERIRRTRPLRVAQMSKQLWDHDFGQDAAIWTAKGWDRKDSHDFQDAKRDVERFILDRPSDVGAQLGIG